VAIEYWMQLKQLRMMTAQSSVQIAAVAEDPASHSLLPIFAPGGARQAAAAVRKFVASQVSEA